MPLVGSTLGSNVFVGTVVCRAFVVAKVFVDSVDFCCFFSRDLIKEMASATIAARPRFLLKPASILIRNGHLTILQHLYIVQVTMHLKLC